MAVREGVPIESLCSLAELVRPDVAELVNGDSMGGACLQPGFCISNG
jgi:hypothetical protein